MSDKVHDPEETAEETAARRIDKGADLSQDRLHQFRKTIRNNIRELSPYKQKQLMTWWRSNCDAVTKMIEDASDEPARLGLSDDLPDID